METENEKIIKRSEETPQTASKITGGDNCKCELRNEERSSCGARGAGARPAPKVERDRSDSTCVSGTADVQRTARERDRGGSEHVPPWR